MRIVHFAPFAPNAAGIYEAARDMCRADSERGHDVVFVDSGATSNAGVRQEPVVGKIDDRGGYAVVAQPVQWADHADLIVLHTGIPDGWIVKSQAPIIVIAHGRPAAAFRYEERHPDQMSYRLYAELAKWPRVKAIVTLWPEFRPYFDWLLGDKLRVLDWPPCDLKRFAPEGPIADIRDRGKVNVLICDSQREDVDCFDVANGAIAAAARVKGLKVHFWAVETQAPTTNVWPRWDVIFAQLRSMGALGEVHAREGAMENVYRAMDMVVTPHRIVTRIVAEAQACGCPVIAGEHCNATPYTADMGDPEDIGAAIYNLAYELSLERAAIQGACVHRAQRFGLERYGKAIEAVYQEAVR